MKTKSWKQTLINETYTEHSITKETSDKYKIQNFNIEDIFLFTSLGWLFVYGSTQTMIRGLFCLALVEAALAQGGKNRMLLLMCVCWNIINFDCFSCILLHHR